MTIDTGGAGRWRGMPGSLNVKQVLEPTMAMAWMVSAAHPLRGMCGGNDASPYANRFEVGTEREYQIDLRAQAHLPAGAVIAYQHGGGAGFEPPLLRDAQAVCEDVLDELVSVAAARATYGVVLQGSLEDYDLVVDFAATQALRAEMMVQA